MAVVTFTTDFGTADPYAGAMKGVVLSHAPDAVLVDITHAIPRHDVRSGAMALAQAARWFPAGTIHVAVVDPGVGGDRADIVVQAAGQYFVAPDNGLVGPAAPPPRKAYRIDNRRFRREPVSPTFHGRDVFAVTAGQLARGALPEDAGPEQASILELRLPDSGSLASDCRGEVIHVDGFGNLVTSFSGGDTVGLWRLVCADHAFEVRGGRTFSDVARGDLVLYMGSAGRVEVALRDGSAAARTQAQVGTLLDLRRQS